MQDKSRERWIVSLSTLVSWRGGRIEIASPVSGAIFQTNNPDILQVIHAFAQPQLIEEVVRKLAGYPIEQISLCIDQLIDSGVIVKSSEEDPVTAHHWERSALAFHRQSRQSGFQLKQPQKSAALHAAQSAATIRLERLSRSEGRDFSDVLESRHSSRHWPKRPISLNTFARLLWMSARNRDCGRAKLLRGFIDRPYPSGGAAYTLELYPIIAPMGVESIGAGIYRYLPDSHRLEPLSEEAENYIPFLEAAGRSAGSHSPPLVLVITSRFARQSEPYGDIAYSLVLKEVGALFQTLYLVAEYLDLAACALGGGSPDELLARLCGTTELIEPVVGEFMIGPR